MITAQEARQIAHQDDSNHKEIMIDLEERIKQKANKGEFWVDCVCPFDPDWDWWCKQELQRLGYKVEIYGMGYRIFWRD